MSAGWLTDERSALASDRILDAAGRLFAEHGVQGTDMIDIARVAGCSRATVYRYFENRSALHRAFVERQAVRIARAAAHEVAGLDDPGERLVAAVQSCLRAVRSEPSVAIWFSPGDLALAFQMAESTALVEALTRTLLDGADDDGRVAARARWLVRVLTSLLAMPGESEDDEREMLERFVVPVIV